MNITLLHEQEGFARAINEPDGEVPLCSSYFFAHAGRVRDFRGPIGNSLEGDVPAFGERTFIEWETAPAVSAQTTVFTWIGASQVRPVRSMFPYVLATLSLDGREILKFPLGTHPSGWKVSGGDCTLTFEPRRHQSLIEQSHRTMTPSGTAGFFRLQVPETMLRADEPLRLRVDLPPAEPDMECVFLINPRRDALVFDLQILRSEMAQMQNDIVRLTTSHEMLYMQFYPELFPRRMPGERSIVWQHEVLHYHPPSLTVMADGEVIISAREASDHIYNDGRIVIFRSRDDGRSWTPPELLFDLGSCDHRSSPIIELPDGAWLATDYRAGGLYYPNGIMNFEGNWSPTLWSAWSSDRGRNWSFSEEPMVVPKAVEPYGEVERHIVLLRNGRLLVASAYLADKGDINKVSIAVFASDDSGKSWGVIGYLPTCPYLEDEATMLETTTGKLILLSRTNVAVGVDPLQRGELLQSDSDDGGITWSPWRPTGMSSMSSPGHLLRLQDGRILCTYASRGYPGEIYLTASTDEGATWNTAQTRVVANDIPNWDSCYPTTGQLADGTLLTTWYANLFGKYFIALFRSQVKDLEY